MDVSAMSSTVGALRTTMPLFSVLEEEASGRETQQRQRQRQHQQQQHHQQHRQQHGEEASQVRRLQAVEAQSVIQLGN